MPQNCVAIFCAGIIACVLAQAQSFNHVAVRDRAGRYGCRHSHAFWLPSRSTRIRCSSRTGWGSRTDDAVIEYNKKYCREELGFTEKMLDDLSSHTNRGTCLTQEIGVVEGRVNFLKKRLDLKRSEMQKIAQRQPTLLARDNVAQKMDYLEERLLLDKSPLRKIVLRCPSVLTMSMGNNNIGPKLNWLQHRLALDDLALSKMIQRKPQTLSFNVDTNIEPTLNWIQQRLDLDDAALSKMIQRLPSLLGYNVETNIEPTLNFYIQALGNEKEALALVIHYPSLISYSLTKRLEPRLREVQDAGIDIDTACLTRLAKYTHERWHVSLASQMNKMNKVEN
mmetsp:Transcript_20161/g.48430  ORF Transcript_20161/g.48430 Transcript_20161/m.48430 type:complete len:337 (+) Transcript_20161:170-1180(+)